MMFDNVDLNSSKLFKIYGVKTMDNNLKFISIIPRLVISNNLPKSNFFVIPLLSLFKPKITYHSLIEVFIVLFNDFSFLPKYDGCH